MRLAVGEEEPFPNYWVDEVNNYLYPNLRLLQAQRDLPGSHRRAFNFPTIGCAEATFNVLPNLPASVSRGIFATPASYRAFLRFSGFDQELHNNSDSKGLAMKVFGVTGAKLLPGFTTDPNVDFLFNANPILPQNNETVLAAAVMARTQLSGGGDRGRASFQNFYPLPYARDLSERGNASVSSSLNLPYYSVSPYKLGLTGAAVKYRVFPCAGAEAPGFNVAAAATNYLSVDLAAKLAANPFCFLFQVQIQNSACNQPINDLSVEWLETESAFVTVATINMTVQTVTNDLNLTCRHTAFNPWRITAEHRPLGSANRARLFAYMNSQNQRLSLNSAVEPSTGLVHPGWQKWTAAEIGINDQFTVPAIKTAFPYNPEAGNFQVPYVPPTPCQPRLCL